MIDHLLEHYGGTIAIAISSIIGTVLWVKIKLPQVEKRCEERDAEENKRIDKLEVKLEKLEDRSSNMEKLVAVIKNTIENLNTKINEIQVDVKKILEK